MNDHNYNVICSGDFNIDMLVDTVIKIEMLTIISSNGCINAFSTPTRIAPLSETAIHLFISNCHIYKFHSGVISYDLSDHLPIFLCVKMFSTKNTKKSKLYFQDIMKDKLDNFRQCIACTDWNDIFRKDSADQAYDKFIRALLCTT